MRINSNILVFKIILASLRKYSLIGRIVAITINKAGNKQKIFIDKVKYFVVFTNYVKNFENNITNNDFNDCNNTKQADIGNNRIPLRLIKLSDK